MSGEQYHMPGKGPDQREAIDSAWTRPLSFGECHLFSSLMRVVRHSWRGGGRIGSFTDPFIPPC